MRTDHHIGAALVPLGTALLTVVLVSEAPFISLNSVLPLRQLGYLASGFAFGFALADFKWYMAERGAD